MWINGIIKVLIVNYFVEVIVGGLIICVFKKQVDFVVENLSFIDVNVSFFFYSFVVIEWFIFCFEFFLVIVLVVFVLFIVFLFEGYINLGQC